MDVSSSPAWEAEVAQALHALGGRATLGDLIVVTGLPRQALDRGLETLIATERAHVTVEESGALVYRLQERRSRVRAVVRKWRAWLPFGGGRAAPRVDRPVGFDRKTLRLIRARGGVISLAELVEHTGLPLSEAEEEVLRLAREYGGEAHPSWDGHVVYAFPELMVSAHGAFAIREPRPAWVRAQDPLRRYRRGRWKAVVAFALDGAGVSAAVGASWFAVARLGTGSHSAAVGLVVSASAVGAFFLGRRALRRWRRNPAHLFGDADTVRRYAIGHVVETALRGKGVVSLDRTVAYLQARAGKLKVSRAAAEKALRKLAAEFDAPITELNGDLFFGFRNVKRQFLASHVQRVRLHLERSAEGGTVFDSGDTPLAASERDLEAFDRTLRDGLPPEGPR